MKCKLFQGFQGNLLKSELLLFFHKTLKSGYPSQSEAKVGWLKFCEGNECNVLNESVTSFSSHTNEARGLKIGMHNPYMAGSKVINHIFEAEIYKFKVIK